MGRRKPLPKTPVEVEVDSLSHDGRGVAHIEGKAVFIDGALAQERVTFLYTRKQRKYDEGKVVSVIEPSPERVEPKCSHYDRCGGCSLQHLSPPGQLSAKQIVLLDNLERIGHVRPLEVLPPIQKDIWSYRSKARLGVRYVPKKEKVLVGFREKHNRFITDSDGCEVLHSRVGSLIEELSSLLGQLSIKSHIPQIEVAIGDDAACLIFRALESLSDADVAALAAFGRQHNIQVLVQPNKPEPIYTAWSNHQPLLYRTDQPPLEMNFQAQDFTQINPSVNRAMIEQAMECLCLSKEDRVLDLFCGLGNFTLPLARRVGQVYGIEGDDELVARAGDNAKHNSINNVVFHKANLFEDQTDAGWLKSGFNKVLIDPPRSGAKEIIPIIAKLKPESILYVSCNPGTLARDAGMLQHEFNYRLAKVGIIDMFPHTAHVESMALFQVNR